MYSGKIKELYTPRDNMFGRLVNIVQNLEKGNKGTLGHVKKTLEEMAFPEIDKTRFFYSCRGIEEVFIIGKDAKEALLVKENEDNSYLINKYPLMYNTSYCVIGKEIAIKFDPFKLILVKEKATQDELEGELYKYLDSEC